MEPIPWALSWRARVSSVFPFDASKAIEVLLYISARCQDTYVALKVLYFADKEHLSQYGRLICGDQYVAMEYGPVPSGAYDLVKLARGQGIRNLDMAESIGRSFVIDGFKIIPLREANQDLLSESDMECLDEAIDRYGHMGFDHMKAISHSESAYLDANQDDVIPLEAIVRSLPDGDALLEYIQAG